jgi:hypothetical protein
MHVNSVAHKIGHKSNWMQQLANWTIQKESKPKMSVLQAELMVMELVQDEPSIASTCVLQSPSNAIIIQDKHSVHDQKAKRKRLPIQT